MRRIAKFRKQRMCALTAAIVATAWMPTAMAMPTSPNTGTMKGVEIQSGTYAETVNGKSYETQDIKVTDSRGVIDWGSFNIGSNEQVKFIGNGSNWMVLNRVTGGELSQIDGILRGQDAAGNRAGTIFLINPAGITFGQGASVEVGSLVASTLWVDDIERNKFLTTDSKTINFMQKNGLDGARITNLANINAADDGIVAILAHEVVSGGKINVDAAHNVSTERLKKMNHINAGQVAMVAGKNITLQYDDKISVLLSDEKEGSTESTIGNWDFVINASDVTANKGYVLMKASNANEVGSNLVCQTGVVKANGMTTDNEGNIILQADNVNAGGELYATGKNAKIEIYGNSIVTATAKAKDEISENGKIIIDSKKGASVALAGKLYADTEVTTKSNHSVVVFDEFNITQDGETIKTDGTVVEVKKKNGTVGDWNIIASKVKVDSGDEDNSLIYTVKKDVYDINSIKDQLANAAYKVSNKVVGNTLATTNVKIKTDQENAHYPISEEEIKNMAANPHYADTASGDNNIEINKDIIKASGDRETSLTMTALNNKTVTVTVGENTKAFELKSGNIELNADIKTDGTAEALKVDLTTYEDDKGNGKIIVNSNDGIKTGERTIYTWGTNRPGTVTINGNITNDDKGTSDSLKIKSGDTKINGTTTLNNLEIYSKGSINVNGNVTVDNNMIARATDDPENGDYHKAKDAVAGKNVNVQAITAGNIVNLAADNNVTINGVVDAGADADLAAVEIVAQGNFLNEVKGKDEKGEEKSKNAVKVKDGSAWKIYSSSPNADNFGSGVGKGNDANKDLNSGNFAVWGWKTGFEYNTDANADGKVKNQYIFKETPKLTITANSGAKKYGEAITDLGYTWSYDLKGKFQDVFTDGNERKLEDKYNLGLLGTASRGYSAEAAIGQYSVNLTKVKKTYDDLRAMGYDVDLQLGTLNVADDVRPQLDNLTTSNLKGSASYSQATRQVGPGADRVLGLQSAELPFFREENGKAKLYGTYDVSIDPDKVKMEPTAKVLPEPDQPKNQYREYEKELTTEAGTAKFKMTYNGSTFDIYPVDNSAKEILVAGDAAKNVEVESQALFAAFKEMGITLDDLDGVYTHFDHKKEVQSFRH